MLHNQNNLFTVIRNTKKPGYWARLSAFGRMLPKFIVIGAQRCGTSSFFTMIKKHPDFRSPLRKEIHYFDLERYPKKIDYQAWFPLKKFSGFTTDITPSYIFVPWAIQAAAKIFPDMRYLVFLRDPVERALSHYHKEVKTGRENRSIEDAFAPLWEQKKKTSIAQPPDSATEMSLWLHRQYLIRGHYLEQLNNCEKAVGKENILVICSEHFFSDPQRQLDRVADFTDIGRWNIYNTIHKNKAKRLPIPVDLKAKLLAYYEPLNEVLFNYLGCQLPWGRYAS